MTIKEALSDTLSEFGILESRIDKALLKFGLNGTETYDETLHLINIYRAEYEVLSTTKSIKSISEGGFDITYEENVKDRKAFLLSIINQAIPVVKPQPIIRAISPW